MTVTPSPRVVVIGEATLYLGHSFTIPAEFPACAHVITDPPYDVEAHTLQRRTLGVGITRARKMKNTPLPFPPFTARERDIFCLRAVPKCEGWFITFCQAETVGDWRKSMCQAGARWRRAGAWIKPDSSPQLSGDRPACGHEAIALGWCGTGRSIWNGGGLALFGQFRSTT